MYAAASDVQLRRESMRKQTVLFLLMAVAASFPLSANLITNGSFETLAAGCPSPGGGFYSVFPPPSTQCMAPWEVVSEDVHLVGSLYWEAADGINSIDLDGAVGSSGGVRQTFATSPGESYLVTFFMAGNPSNLPVVKPMRVSADGQSAEFTFDVTGTNFTNMGWTLMNWSFVADDATATLTFQSLTQERGLLEGWGPALDNVSVTEISTVIPEPTTWLLMSGSFTLLLLLRRLSPRGI
jgi:choice-of-anchor C domain-containing protein